MIPSRHTLIFTQESYKYKGLFENCTQPLCWIIDKKKKRGEATNTDLLHAVKRSWNVKKKKRVWIYLLAVCCWVFYFFLSCPVFVELLGYNCSAVVFRANLKMRWKIEQRLLINSFLAEQKHCPLLFSNEMHVNILENTEYSIPFLDLLIYLFVVDNNIILYIMRSHFATLVFRISWHENTS